MVPVGLQPAGTSIDCPARSAKQPSPTAVSFLGIHGKTSHRNEYALTEFGLLALSNRMDGRPKVGWLQAQSLQCIALALRAKDPRIKRLYTLEAERWLHLAELEAGHNLRYTGAPQYQGVERRMTARHPARKAGVIMLERDALIECAVRDFSPAGVGLSIPDRVFLPAEFDLTFNHATQRCITVWRRTEQMGLRFSSA
jgi:hypothetical protein